METNVKLELKVERVEYNDKAGNTKVAYNYYVDLPLGDNVMKVQLKPNDYTSRQLLETILLG